MKLYPMIVPETEQVIILKSSDGKTFTRAPDSEQKYRGLMFKQGIFHILLDELKNKNLAK